MISCYDPATPNNERITIEEGVNFIELMPYNFNVGTVYVKAGLDYEVWKYGTYFLFFLENILFFFVQE